MPESGLSLTYFDFAADLGEFLGWGRGSEYGDTAWTTRQAAAIESDVADGQRQFYWPMVLPGEKAVHSWTFLKPIMSLTLASGDSEVSLPDDFLKLLGDVIVSESGTASWHQPLKLHNAAKIRQLFALRGTDATGPPEIAALEAQKGVTPNSSSDYKLKVFPVADRAYTLEFQYEIAPEAMAGARPYCYGGVVHVSTIQAACRMATEQRRNDKLGIWTMKFQEQLAKSIAHDRKNNPKWHGTNPHRWGRPTRWRENHGSSAVLVAGIDPTT